MIYKCLICFSVIYLLMLGFIVFKKFIKPRLEVEHYLENYTPYDPLNKDSNLYSKYYSIPPHSILGDSVFINKLLCEKKRKSEELLHNYILINDKFKQFSKDRTLKF